MIPKNLERQKSVHQGKLSKRSNLVCQNSRHHIVKFFFRNYLVPNLHLNSTKLFSIVCNISSTIVKQSKITFPNKTKAILFVLVIFNSFGYFWIINQTVKYKASNTRSQLQKRKWSEGLWSKGVVPSDPGLIGPLGHEIIALILFDTLIFNHLTKVILTFQMIN